MPTLEEKRAQLRLLQKREMLKSLQASAPRPEAPAVKDEMPEWLETSDRAIVKNLAKNPEESLKFLQQKYPDAEFQASGDEIIARKRGEKDFGKLDPSFSPFSNPLGTLKDLGRDALDLGYDALQMGAETGGAIAGTALAPGVGTVAGAGAGAGAASTLKEALRKHYGLTDEISLSDIATDATIGAVVPVALKKTGQAIKAGATKVAPKLYAKATGLTTDALKRIADKGDEIAGWDETKVLSNLQGTGDDLSKWVQKGKGEFAEKYKQLRGGAEDIDLAGVNQEFDDAIRATSEQYERTGIAAFKEQADQLMSMKNEILGGSARPSVGISDAMDLDSRISNDWIDWADDIGQGVGSGRTISSTQEALAKKLRGRLRGDINKSTYGSLQNTADEYSKFIDQVNFIRKNFKDPKKTAATLKRLNEGKDDVLAGQFKNLDPRLQGIIDQHRGDQEIFRYFKPDNKNLTTVEGVKDFVGGRTPLAKTLGPLAAGVGYMTAGVPGTVAGGYVGRSLGGAITSPGAVRRVSKAGAKVGSKLEELKALLEERPELLRLLEGATFAGVSE